MCGRDGRDDGRCGGMYGLLVGRVVVVVVADVDGIYAVVGQGL